MDQGFLRTSNPDKSVPGATVLSTAPYFLTFSCSSVYFDLIVDEFMYSKRVLTVGRAFPGTSQLAALVCLNQSAHRPAQ